MIDRIEPPPSQNEMDVLTSSSILLLRLRGTSGVKPYQSLSLATGDKSSALVIVGCGGVGSSGNKYKHPTSCNLRLRNPRSSHFRKACLTSMIHRQFRPSLSKSVTSLFTGIVEEIGKIQTLGSSKDGIGFDMTISAKNVLSGTKLGDSIAVNGVCLTVTELNPSAFTVGLAPETLRKTSLEDLVAGSSVNLERAVLANTRMGGHFVQGHVDGTGQIVSMVAEEDSLWIKVKTTTEILKFIVPKGFIAVDGTSLTVVGVYDEDQCFDFMLVNYTQENVVIPMKKVDDKVNLEVDILGKYVHRMIQNYSKE